MDGTCFRTPVRIIGSSFVTVLALQLLPTSFRCEYFDLTQIVWTHLSHDEAWQQPSSFSGVSYFTVSLC